MPEPALGLAGMMGQGTPLMDSENLLELYGNPAFARRMAAGLVGEGAVEDVWQDAWRMVLERPPRPDWDLRGHVWTIVRRLAQRRRRGEARRKAREHAVAREERLPSSAELVERMEVHRGVVNALLELAEPYRRTLLLVYFADLDPAEIARRDGIPVETVRTRKKRALAQLRERLEHEHGNDRDWLRGLIALAGGRAELAPAVPWTTSLAVSAALLVTGGLALLAWAFREQRPIESSRGLSLVTPDDPRDAGTSEPRALRSAAPASTRPEDAGPGVAETRSGIALGGRASDEAGRGISGAEVAARITGLRTVEPLASVRTDAAGNYSLFLPARSALEVRGRFLTLEAWAAGYGCQRLELPLAEVQASRATELELDELVLSTGRTVAGRVLDQRGDPVTKALVVARGREGGEAKATETITTDALGEFRLGLRDGFEPDGIEAWRTDVGWGELGRSLPEAAADGLVRAGDVVLHEFALLRGQATYPDGSPVRDLGIVARLAAEDERGRFVRAPRSRGGLALNGFTDEAGRFALAGLGPGPYAFGAVRNAPRADSEHGLAREVLAWPERGEARLTLEHRRVLVEVADATGRALEDVWVVCTRLARDGSDSKSGWRPAGPGLRTLTRGPAGRASFTGPPMGPMALTVLLPGWAREFELLPDADSWESVLRVELAPEEPRGAVRLVTRDGRPLEGLAVHLTTPAARVPLDRSWSSDREGCVRDLPAGRFRAEIFAANDAADPWLFTNARLLEIPAAGIVDVPVEAERGGRLVVTFRTSGEELPPARERARSGSTWLNLETWAGWQPPRAQAYLVREGGFDEPVELAGARAGDRWISARPLRPGKYRFEATIDGYEPTSQWLVIEAERTRECAVLLTRAAGDRR